MLKKTIQKLIKYLPSGKYILFESVPDLSDSTKAVFDEMIHRELNKKYKFIWMVSDKRKKWPQYCNVKYIDNRSAFSRRLLWWYRYRAKCLISCNRFLKSLTVNQISFYITHGTVIKRLGDYTLPANIDYAFVAAEHVREVMAYEMKGDVNKFIALGYPRNDVLLEKPVDIKTALNTNCKKIIVWYPTFRQHINGKKKTDSSHALPIIHNVEMAKQLNDSAKMNDVLIVLKPHFAQDLSEVKDLKMSNIRFIDDGFFVENKMSSYEFVGSCDALITDYSSIYYDFTLCDKPIAVIWEDFEEYQSNPGFAVDVDYYLKGAEKIYTLQEFEQFVTDVSEGKDRLKEARQEIRDLVNYAVDNKNAKRVVDFIIEKAEL